MGPAPAALVTGVGLSLPGHADAARLVDPRGSRIVAEAPSADPLAGRGLRYKDRATRLGLAATGAALRHAGLLGERGVSLPGRRVGVVVSSNLGNLDTVCRVVETIAEETVGGTSPMDLPNASSNVIASSIAIRFALGGVNLTLCNGATSGLDALHWAVLLLAAGRVEAAVVCGVETANPVVERLVDGGRVGDGARPSRLLDGAVAVVVEPPAPVARPAAVGLATLGGYARRATLAESVRHALGPGSGEVGIWFVAEDHADDGPWSAGLDGVPTSDLSQSLGACSGALGVLQCWAAVAWLGSTTDGTALLTAGGSGDDASAAMVVSGGEGA
ncbi:MAG: hypothetical protein M3N68_05960 [Actinomycetota bacterium]|nr:hypothetical protein [Actinomycetota bacterium]